MGEHIVKIKAIDKVTHDTLKIVTEKPEQYIINAKKEWKPSIP